MFNYLVVGGGLFGSAAARYLSAQADRVAVIGPAEPADWATRQGVFASHYDNGRLCSMFGTDAVWTQIHRASIAQYRHIEAASGVDFYTPAGRLGFFTPNQGKKLFEYLQDDEGRVEIYRAETFPFNWPVAIPPERAIFYEPAPSGYINPRKLVEAQLTIAARQGAQIIEQTVQSIVDHQSHVVVQTMEGAVFSAEKVLLATGAFTNQLDLLTRKIALRTKTETTILAEVSRAEAERCHGMPTVTYDIDDPEIHAIYLAPPLQYPDGRYYLKMGFDTPTDQLNPSLGAVHDWFAGTTIETHKAAAINAVRVLFPDLNVLSWRMKPCIVCYTPSRKPMIDAIVPDRIYVAVAGNGTGAGPSDAIGRLGADLMLNGQWIADFDHGPFQTQYVDANQAWYDAPLTIF